MACACGGLPLSDGQCPNCAGVSDEIAARRQVRTVDALAAMKFRQQFGFGIPRLKMFLWLIRHPEIDRGHWTVQMKIGDIGDSVKIAAYRFENVTAESS